MKRSWKVLQSFAILRSIRSSKSPQKVHKILKNTRKCTKGTQGPRSPQVLSWSSKYPQKVKKMHKRSPTSSGLRSSNDPQITQKVLKLLEVLRGLQKVFKTTSKSSKSYQRPQNPVIVKSSSNGHQMVLTKSSRVPKNSPKKGPQEFLKRSWKVLQSFAIIRSSVLQKVLKRFTKSSKIQENAQKVPKVLAVLRFSADPQDVLNFLKRSSKPSKSTEVHKRYSRRPQIPQKFNNVLKILWSSKVPQMVIKWSSGLGSSNDPQITQKVLKILEILKGPQKILKSSSKSSKIYQRPQNPVIVKSSSNGHQMVLTKSSRVPKNSPKKGPQEFLKRSWKVLQSFAILRSSVLQSSKVHKILKNSRKSRPSQPSGSQLILKISSKGQENAQKVPNVLRTQVLKWSSNYSKGPQNPRSPQRSCKRYSKRPQSPQKFINVLKILWSSKVPQMVIKWSSQSPQSSSKQSEKRSTRIHQKVLKSSSIFCDPQVLRSSKSPQKVHKILKKSRKCTKGTQGPRSPQVLNWSSNVLNFLKRSSKPSKSTEVHKRYSRRPQIPQKFINVLKILWSSKVPQMVIKWSSGLGSSNVLKTQKVPKSSKSWKVLKRSSNVLKNLSTSLKPSSGSQRKSWKVLKSSKASSPRSTRSHQKFLKVLQWSESIRSSFFKKSSKGPQNPQKFKKMHKRYPRSSQSSGSHVILKMSSISSKGPQSPRSPQRSAKGIQNGLKFLKKLSTSSKSCGRQKFLKWSSNGPHKFLKSSKKQSEKRSTRIHEKVLKSSSIFCDPQVHRSSKSPQKVHKILKKARKCTKGTQGPRSPQASTDPQNILKRSRKCTKGPQRPQDSGPQMILKLLKRSSNSSKSSEVCKRYSKRPQSPQKVINVLKILWSSKVPQMVIKWSSQSPQEFLKTVRKKVHKNSWKGPEKFFNLLRSSGHQFFKKSSKGSQNPQKFKKMHKRYPRSSQSSGSQLILKMSSISSKGHQSPRSPQRFTKGIQDDLKFLKNLTTSSKSCDRQKFLEWSSNGPQDWVPQMILKLLKRFSKSSKSWKVLKRYSNCPQSPQKFINVLKILWSSKVPQMVIKWSSQSPQEFLKTVRKKVHKNSWKGP